MGVRSKRIEVFNRKHRDRVRRIGKSENGVILEVILEKESIPESVEVYGGALLMPEQEYRLEGRKVQFPANGDSRETELTVKYYPRAPTHEQ